MYLDPSSVAKDFGSDSITTKIAETIFNQTPNIITGGGHLVIIPLLPNNDSQPAILRSDNPVDLTTLTGDDYKIKAIVNGNSVSIDIGNLGNIITRDSVLTSLNNTDVQSAGLRFSIDGDIDNALITLKTQNSGSGASITVETATNGTDILGLFNISGSTSGNDSGLESLKDAILRTETKVSYFGILSTKRIEQQELLQVASFVQGLDKLLFVASDKTTDITGIFGQIKEMGYTHTRCLIYTISNDNNSNDLYLCFAAGYASRGLSTNFDGDKTTATMQLKEIVGFVADNGIDQTLYSLCNQNGVDCLVNLSGLAKVISNGANNYFDEIYIQIALKIRLQIAGFNALATLQTKIPQTEEGMTFLKSAYIKVIKTFKENGAVDKGEWTGIASFGDPEDFKRNIREQGYYILSKLISQQSQIDRNKRKAPLIQIAVKMAGAIHTSEVTFAVES